MTEISKVPFNRSYWVIPGKLLAGYPGSEDPAEEGRKLKRLIKVGNGCKDFGLRFRLRPNRLEFLKLISFIFVTSMGSMPHITRQMMSVCAGH